MPIYRFEYLDDFTEAFYCDFADDEAAIEEAHQAIIETAKDRVEETLWFETIAIAVYGADGSLVVTAKVDTY